MICYFISQIEKILYSHYESKREKCESLDIVHDTQQFTSQYNCYHHLIILAGSSDVSGTIYFATIKQ